MFLYSVSDSKITIDVKCAFLVELAEPIVEVVKERTYYFASLEPGSRGTTLKNCLDALIIKYGKEVGGKDFEGKCYVFDNRVAVDVNSTNPAIISQCRNCGSTTSKMINCANPECNEHFTQCDDCGIRLDGACSTECMAHPRKRQYDGSGYYVKVPQNHISI